MQLVPKGSAAARRGGAAEANPWLALTPDPTRTDYSYWNRVAEERSEERAAVVAERRRQAAAAPVEPLLVDEAEPDAVRGGNDTAANAQPIPQFGSGAGKRAAARVLGTVAPERPVAELAAVTEDNGAIPLAGETGVAAGTSARTTGTIGDGPHGSAGSGTGDFDFYAVRGGAKGHRLVVNVDTPTGALDSLVLLYDASGRLVALHDDISSTNTDSRLVTRLPADGDYFVAVSAFSVLPQDPVNPASGTGVDTEGPYQATFGLDANDFDVYAVDLKAGDVLAGSVSGSGTLLAVLDPAGREMQVSQRDITFLYPAASPLPGGGKAVMDHVAARTGQHFVAVSGTPGNYDVTLEVYRPGAETKKVTQTIFLDFDGARVNTAIFNGPGVRTLSPLSAFLGRWQIAASQEDALIDQIIATVTENLRSDFAGQGTRVRILNSRDHADPFGQPNVSRLVVGGTIAESGINTIGIAQTIDPGNYDTAETALILLDTISGPAPGVASFNTYLRPESDRVGFVGTALGNIASHEAGHYLGSWHVEHLNDVYNLMDRGGNYAMLYGVGPDRVGGTADDPDNDFGEDLFNPLEGFFSGIEDTAARTRWALHR